MTPEASVYLNELHDELMEMVSDVSTHQLHEDQRRAAQVLANRILKQMNDRNTASTSFLLVAATLAFCGSIKALADEPTIEPEDVS